MNDRKLSEEDVERVSSRVAAKLVRYAAIGVGVWFIGIPLVLMLFFGVCTFSGAGPGGRF